MSCDWRALTGQSGHAVTFNDYPTQPDAGWVDPVYRFVGRSAGSVQYQTDSTGRTDPYACDVTCLTVKQADFGSLR